MKIILALLNALMIGWLLFVTPIVRVAAGTNAGSKYAELDGAGVSNQVKLVEYQKNTQASFQPDNKKSIGAWLTRNNAYTAMLILPCGIVIAINTAYLIASMFMRKKTK